MNFEIYLEFKYISIFRNVKKIVLFTENKPWFKTKNGYLSFLGYFTGSDI